MESFARKTKIQFKVITFIGDIVSTLDVEIINEEIPYTRYSVTQIHTDSNQLLIGVVDEGSTKELYDVFRTAFASALIWWSYFQIALFYPIVAKPALAIVEHLDVCFYMAPEVLGTNFVGRARRQTTSD